MIFIVFVFAWYASLFMQTFFQHRYAAHGAFTMRKSWERFFFILTYLAQGPHYMNPKTYGIMHRLHHAYTDTEKDPHSPLFSSNVFALMWRTTLRFRAIHSGREIVSRNFTYGLPEWQGFDKWASSPVSRLLWVIIYSLIFVYFTTAPWQYIFLPLIIILGPLHGAIVNWFAHRYGYRNFILKNTARNLFRLDWLMLGESYHNNHHKYPSKINFGSRWHELDPVYPVILLMARLRIIRIKKQSPVHRDGSL